ncbi:MAG TPA: hypothetical protein VEZ11_12405 [Thermoanaerobaculia bacterium]|nr:hypothetical protein [Thermoanaerobaculia bacterium]
MRQIIVVLRVAAAMLLAGAAAYTLDRLCVEPLRCARAASAGATSLDALVRSDDLNRRVAYTILANLRPCECLTPSDTRILATRGAAFAVAGDARSAIADYRAALATERRPEVYLELGLAQLDAFDRAGAIDSLTRACAFDPSRLSDIPYEEIRNEVKRRFVAVHEKHSPQRH